MFAAKIGREYKNPKFEAPKFETNSNAKNTKFETQEEELKHNYFLYLNFFCLSLFQI